MGTYCSLRYNMFMHCVCHTSKLLVPSSFLMFIIDDESTIQKGSLNQNPRCGQTKCLLTIGKEEPKDCVLINFCLVQHAAYISDCSLPMHHLWIIILPCHLSAHKCITFAITKASYAGFNSTQQDPTSDKHLFVCCSRL